MFIEARQRYLGETGGRTECTPAILSRAHEETCVLSKLCLSSHSSRWDVEQLGEALAWKART